MSEQSNGSAMAIDYERVRAMTPECAKLTDVQIDIVYHRLARWNRGATCDDHYAASLAMASMIDYAAPFFPRTARGAEVLALIEGREEQAQ